MQESLGKFSQAKTIRILSTHVWKSYIKFFGVVVVIAATLSTISGSWFSWDDGTMLLQRLEKSKANHSGGNVKLFPKILERKYEYFQKFICQLVSFRILFLFFVYFSEKLFGFKWKIQDPGVLCFVMQATSFLSKGFIELFHRTVLKC